MCACFLCGKPLSLAWPGFAPTALPWMTCPVLLSCPPVPRPALPRPFLRVAVLCFAVLRGRVAKVPYLTEKQVPHSRAEQFNVLLRTMRRLGLAPLALSAFLRPSRRPPILTARAQRPAFKILKEKAWQAQPLVRLLCPGFL